MTAFFVKTDDSAAGPFTGVELAKRLLLGLSVTTRRLAPDHKGPGPRRVTPVCFPKTSCPCRILAVHACRPITFAGCKVGPTGPFKPRELIGFASAWNVTV